MPLVKIGFSAIDTDEVHRITDRGETVDVHFKGDRGGHESYPKAADKAALRKLVKSLPATLGGES
jgi:hypothetical protein